MGRDVVYADGRVVFAASDVDVDGWLEGVAEHAYETWRAVYVLAFFELYVVGDGVVAYYAIPFWRALASLLMLLARWPSRRACGTA